jgi:glycosyltransferase involved in cell wall biosynthesis
MSAPGAGRVLLACDFHRHYAAMLAAGLDRAGAEVALLTRDHDLEFGNRPGASREFVEATVGSAVRVREIGGRVRSPAGWAEALRQRRELRAWRPSVTHFQESVGNDVRLLYAARARRGRFALTVHDPVRHPGDNESRRLAWFNEMMIARAGLIFVHAEALREELISIAAPRAPIVVVPHGVDPGAATSLPERPSILFFGRISHYKGLDTLLDAMPEIWEEIPETRLTVAGDGPIEPHPVLADPRVTLHAGHVPESEVPALFAGASCVALPYRQASQSGVGSRVKPYARPLVVTETGGLPELVADGSGLVVPPESPARLARALVEVLADRALAERLGAAGAATAEREGSWDVVSARTLEAYREHLGADV